jgi:hypothetical protein
MGNQFREGIRKIYRQKLCEGDIGPVNYPVQIPRPGTVRLSELSPGTWKDLLIIWSLAGQILYLPSVPREDKIGWENTAILKPST